MTEDNAQDTGSDKKTRGEGAVGEGDAQGTGPEAKVVDGGALASPEGAEAPEAVEAPEAADGAEVPREPGPPPPPPPPLPPRAKGLRIAYLVLCLVGLAASVELIRLHVKAHTRPSERSFCSVHSKVDCLSVAESPWAVFLGVPVAAWAVLAFIVLMAGTVVVLARQWRRSADPRRGDSLAGLTFVLSLGAVGVAGCMAFVSHVIIGTLCLVCAALYVVNTTLAVLGWRIAARHGGVVRAVRADLASVRGRWKLAAGMAAGGLAVAAGMIVAYPAYWRYLGPVGPGDLSHGVTEEGHPWIGAKEPELILHEFSDYECGFCRHYNKELRKILQMEDFRKKIRVVHYHYPLDRSCNRTVPQEFHLRACELARAAYCAGQQGKFWHMHDMLYARMRPGGPAVLGLAGKLGLDQRRFRQCMESQEARAKVKADIERGEQMARQVSGRGINGTPTYFVQKPGQEPRALSPNERSLRLALEQIPQQQGPAGMAHGETVEGLSWIGAREPRVTLYEVSDYNCFFCMRGHFLTRQLLKEAALRDQVRIVHVQYPFDSQCNPAFKERQHPRACSLARASLCAKAQGKFWEMNDLIYRAFGAGRIPTLPVLGRRLRLDGQKFAACLGSKEIDEGLDGEIQFSERLGALDKKGIDGIPSVFFQVGKGPIARLVGRVEREWLQRLLAPGGTNARP